MKKLIIIVLWVFISGIFSLNANASTVTLWWDVKGITDKDATSPPSTGDKQPDTWVNLIPCQKVWLDLYVSNIPSPGADFFDFELIYDANQFTFDPPLHPSIKLGPGWTYQPYSDNSSSGLIIAWAGAETGKAFYGDNIEIALIDLHCKKVGSYTLIFDYFYLYETGSGDLFQIEYIPLTINNVPIPGTLILIGSGLLGLIGLRRRFHF